TPMATTITGSRLLLLSRMIPFHKNANIILQIQNLKFKIQDSTMSILAPPNVVSIHPFINYES
ncbi:MAG: hypothetical protein PHQ24_12755, partial [Proteiniphilum sp.]|nr:hypothetical protein [Proteiniphilum sp.]